MEQRWHRTVGNLAAFIVGNIIYAKSKGETAEDYGKFLGELHALSWNKERAGEPAYLVGGISRNFQMLENFRLVYKQELQTEWIYFTVSVKK